MQQSKVQKLVDKMTAGQPVFGCMMLHASIEMVEILAYTGFDFIFVDQMFTTTDWKEMGNIVRAMSGSEMAVICRVENDPWNGGDDPGIPSRVGRALGVGCDGVKINVYSKNEARWAVEAGAGWHRKPHIVEFAEQNKSATEQFKEFESKEVSNTLIIPSIESQLGIKQVDDILDIPGMRMFGIAMTDTAIMLGHPMEYEHPDVWAFVDRVAARAHERGIFMSGGTGYAYTTWDAIAGRAKRLHEHGIDMIMLQTSEFIFQLATRDVLRRVRDEFGLVRKD